MTRDRIQIVMPDDPRDDAQVFSPYEALEVVRSVVPSSARRWRKTRPKHWAVSVLFVPSLAESLRVAGWPVHLTHRDGSPWSPRGRSSGHGSTPAPDWVEAAFADCPLDRVDKLRRGMLAAHHPDHGGDAELAKRINAAADARLRGRP